MNNISRSSQAFSFSVLLFVVVDIVLEATYVILFPRNRMWVVVGVQSGWLLWGAFTIVRYRIDLTALVGRTALVRSDWRWFASLVILLSCVTSLLFLGFYLMLNRSPQAALTLLNVPLSSGAATFITQGMSVLVTPVIEELVFRGLILQQLMHRFSVFKSVLLSSLLFACVHAQAFGVIQFFCGILFALTYLNTRSLLVTTLLHLTWNIPLAVVALLGSRLHSQTLVPRDMADFAIRLSAYVPWVVFVLVLCTGCLLWFFIRTWPRERITPYAFNSRSYIGPNVM